MKVTTTTSPSFKPITITITLETPAELEVMQSFASLDVDIPIAIKAHGCDENQICITAEFLEQLHRALIKY